MVFTGIVEEIGKVGSLDKEETHLLLSIFAKQVLQDLHIGDSIAVNGVCLTVCSFDDQSFVVGISPETLRRTNLEQLKEASPVNLERALSAQGRFGGHIVQGHVDGVGTIRSMYPEGDSLWFWVDTTREIAAFVVEKGYIAVDGTSLTVCATQDCSFQFMLVAYTQQHVILPQKQVGDQVNLEVDILGKYVKQFIKQD
ncbi:riboflavin synthase alpha chain [Galdieria sulphuraria]|uniref:Riboflavin synthase n=1 Tax=Galdieria sulphuraria TaxID=130081 RepID=M2Y2Y0_GALSU|nr:riboflavin synthase alpha chain [Galdieria sulphuraria]EME30298.1 riboflavin synthase alpha chain [Galdieria sulphuraria]|eukprot:XP_005706818.1 riboflavin synthase alpha chain [Galdieria sulphuraria]